MAFKTNIDAQLRGFYFAESGNDDFSGSTIETPKRTIQAAIDAAFALDPIPQFGNIGLVNVAQGGSFSEGFILENWIQFNAEDVTIDVSQPIVATIASFLSLRIAGITNNQNGGICFQLDGKQVLGLDALFMNVAGDSAIGLNVTGTVDDLFLSISRVLVTGSGSTGISITSTNANPTDININTVALGANNAIFMDYAPVSGTTVVAVSSIIENGVLGTIAFNASSGEIVVLAGRIVAETIADVSGSAQFSLKCNAMNGNTIIRGTSVGNYKSIGFIDGDIDVEDTAILLCDVHFIFGNITVAIGATLSLTCATLIGDLTINGSADVFVFNHVGTLTVSGTLNGIINGEYFGTYLPQTILSAASFSSQDPLGLDTPLQVEFGAAQGTVADPVMISAAGAITINDAGRYRASLSAQYGRVGAGAASWLFFRILVNSIQIGDSMLTKLDNANSDLPLQFETVNNLDAGDVMTFEVIRDSQGFDSGSLFSEVPTPAGWSASPSAHITMIKE